MRLLCIANPEAYRGGGTDVPLSYARLAAHPDLELFHLDTRDALSATDRVPAVAVLPGFRESDFDRLPKMPTTELDLQAFDLAFCRTLKPFPPGYLSRLEGWTPDLQFVNNPSGIRRQLEPQFFLDAAGAYAPESILADEAPAAREFLVQYGQVVAKRPNSCGGRGVYRLIARGQGAIDIDNVIEGKSSFASFDELFEHLAGDVTGPLLFMRYLPRVTEGDKRIVVLDGQAIGAYLRKSGDGHWVQNVSRGARAERVALSPQDVRLVSATCTRYSQAGIHLLGYDLIRDDEEWKIGEINAGNIGGLFRLEAMGVPGVTDHFVAWMHGLRDTSG